MRLQAYASTAPAVAPANLARVRLNENAQNAYDIQRMHGFLLFRSGHFEGGVTVADKEDRRMELDIYFGSEIIGLDFSGTPCKVLTLSQTISSFIIASSYL